MASEQPMQRGSLGYDGVVTAVTVPTPPVATYVCARCGYRAREAGTCSRDQTLLTAATDPLLGDSVHGYTLVECVGAGGMGRVYRGVEPTINAEVAVKVLTPQAAGDPELTERFIAEARAANLIRDDGFVKVLALGALPDGRPYQVMEHLTGEPLSTVVARGPLGVAAGCATVVALARSVAVLHAGGVIHRDLKPSNIFITTSGAPKILDFGIAKARALAIDLTETGHVLGTPGYMAPEQALGEPIDERVDIYALGVILYELVGGRRPFEPDEQLAAFADRAAPPPLPVECGAPPALDDIIAKAMAFAARDRYATARELGAAIAGVIGEDGALPSLTANGPQLTTSTVWLGRRTAEPVAIAHPEYLGKYRVERALAAGGAGELFLAIDPVVERRVAIKLLQRGDSHERERMVDEARALARVVHPNVVTMYELGETADGRPLLAMEYVEGGDLAAWIRTPRPWREIVTMFAAAGDGIAAAHAAGVVHRDFKPANVLLGGDLRPRVGDFGLAQRDDTAIASGGTPGYMAPEQVGAGAIDARADQFAFSASLWHALHGELPYAGVTPHAIAVAAMRRQRRMPRNHAVPNTINRVLGRALAADPNQRYSTMGELLTALRRAARPRRWSAIAGAALTVATGAAVLVAWPSAPSSPPSDPPVAPPASALALAKTQTDPWQQITTLAAATDDELATPAARSLAAEAARRGPSRAIEQGSAISAVAMSPDGERVAVALAREIRVHQLTGTRVVTIPIDEPIRRMGYRGTQLVALGQRTTMRIDSEGRIHARRCLLSGPSVAPADLSLVGCPVSGGFQVFRVDDDREQLTIDDAVALTFSPTGKLAMVTRRSGTVAIYDLATAKVVATRAALPANAALGEGVIAYNTGTAIETWDIVSHQIRRRDVGAIASLTIDADDAVSVIDSSGAAGRWRAGQWRRIGGTNATAIHGVPGGRVAIVGRANLELVSLDTQRRLTLGGAFAPDLAWSSDGTKLAAFSGTAVHIWYVGLLPSTIIPFGARSLARFSPTGRYVVLLERDHFAVRDASEIGRTLWSAPFTPTVLHFVDDDHLIAALDDGRIVELAVATQTITTLATIANPKLLTTLGDKVFVADGSYQLWQVGSPSIRRCESLRVTDLTAPYAVGGHDGRWARCDLASGRLTDLDVDQSAMSLLVTRFGTVIVVTPDGSIRPLDSANLTMPPNTRWLEQITATQWLATAGGGMFVIEPNAPPRMVPGSRSTTLTTRASNLLGAVANRDLLVWDLDHLDDPPTYYGSYDVLGGVAISHSSLVIRSLDHYEVIDRALPQPATIRGWVHSPR